MAAHKLTQRRLTKSGTLAASIRDGIMAEAELDIDTTVGAGDGSDESGSGNHPNHPVPAQPAADAGKTHELDVDAERPPGEPTPGAMDGVHHGLPDTNHLDGAGVRNEGKFRMRNEAANVSALFPGNFVRVVEKDTQITVDRGIIRNVFRREIHLQGGVKYEQDKYQFIRLA